MGRTVEGMTKKTTSGDKIILQPPPPAKKQKMKTGVAIATMTVCYNWYLSLSTYVCNIHFFFRKVKKKNILMIMLKPHLTVLSPNAFYLKNCRTDCVRVILITFIHVFFHFTYINILGIGGRLLVRMSTSTHNAKPEPMVFFQIGEFKKVEGKKWENVNDTLRTYCLETFCKMLEKLPVMVQNIPKLKEAELEKLINGNTYNVATNYYATFAAVLFVFSAPTKPLRLSQCDCNCLRRKKKKC